MYAEDYNMNIRIEWYGNDDGTTLVEIIDDHYIVGRLLYGAELL